MPAVGFLHAEERGDVRVIEHCQYLRLAAKPCGTFRIGHYRFQDDFDRNLATKLGVASAIDLTHAAGADGRADFVRPQAGSW